ncbi:MAG TPA: PilN domain-containing protein [Fimbriimonas sp.]|nr:PilN domain-containing protein [Fimbriimonas sp.]
MPIINLIQEQRLAAQKREQRARIAFTTFVGVLAAGVLGYGYLFYEKQALSTKAASLNQTIQKMAPIVAQINDCKKQQSLLDPRFQTLEDAAKTSGRWTHILTHLETQTPAGTWLTGMQCQAVQQDKPVSIVLTGTSKAQEPISEFILRVQNEPNLENVNLHFTQEKRSMTGKAIDFEIGADVAGTLDKKNTIKEDTRS